MDDTRLGAILLEGGVVDETGLERCLAIQSLTGSTRPIGQILVEHGLMEESTLKRLLELQRDRIELRHAPSAPTSMASAALVTAAVANGASDLVVSEGRPARIRVGEAWQQLTDEPLTGPEVWDFVRETMGSEVLEQLAERHFVARPWAISGVGAGTAAAFRQFEGVTARLTLALATAASAEAAGVPPALAESLRVGKGLFLVVGERGLGRATVLSTFVSLLATDSSDYVVIVGDEPLPLPDGGALVVRRRFGLLPTDRADALRGVISEDPDALVVADVGTPEAFEIALRAAEGGRRVVAWIDGTSATAALVRILNFYPVHDLPHVRATLAAVLRAVFVRLLLPDADHTGTVAATELLLADDAVREVIRGGELGDLSLLLRADGSQCGHSLDRSMLLLLQRGRVRMEDVFVRTEEKAWLLERTRNQQTEAR